MKAILILIIFFGISYGQTINIDLPQKKLDLFVSHYNDFLKTVHKDIKKLRSMEEPVNRLSDKKNLDLLITGYDRLLKKISKEKIIILTKYEEYSESVIQTLSEIGVSNEKIKDISDILTKATDYLAKSFDQLEDFLYFKKEEFVFLKNSKFSINKNKIVFNSKQEYEKYKNIRKKSSEHLKKFNHYTDLFLKYHKKAVRKVNELF